MAYIDIVKPWFETGDKPTQNQFWTLFGYLRFKDDAIAVADIAGLSDLLTGKAAQTALDAFIGGELQLYNADAYYDIPAGYLLEKLIVAPAIDINLQIGNSVSNDDIAAQETVTASAGVVYVVNIFARATKRIYFTGCAAGTQVVFFKRKVNLG